MYTFFLFRERKKKYDIIYIEGDNMLHVKDILHICNGKLICGDENTECINFTNDTRTLNKGDVFVGIKGDTFNGNSFYKEGRI